MSKGNIERFDTHTGQIFAYLYDHFPVPVTLDVRKFVENATRWSEHLDMEVPTERADFFTATVRWLGDAGYIRSKKIIGGFLIEESVLTAKALEVLKATPDSLTGASIGEKMQEAASEGMLEALKGLANQALSRGVGMATTAAVSMAGSI